MRPSKAKSRTFRRISRKTPGGKTVVHYKKGKPAVGKCSSCGAVLKGVPRERPHKMMKMTKTKKRPERPYGGKLCSKCMRKHFKETARK